MNLIRFDEELLTHVPEMDKQHENLINLLNKVTILLKEGKREEALDLFYNELIEYVEFHLKSEEEFMRKIGFPELETHVKIHELFRKEILSLLPYVKDGDYSKFKEAWAICWGWLYNHIAKTDKKYSLYAKEIGLI